MDRALLAVCRSGSYPSGGIHLESKLTLHIAPLAFEYFLPGLIVQLNCNLPFELWSFVLRPNGIEPRFTILGVTHMFRSVGDRTDCWNRTQYNRHSPKGERNKGRWLVAYQTCRDCCLHPNKQVRTSYLWYKPVIGDSWQCWELSQECNREIETLALPTHHPMSAYITEGSILMDLFFSREIFTTGCNKFILRSFKSVKSDMSVHLSRLDTSVSQHELHSSHIFSLPEQVGCKGMT